MEIQYYDTSTETFTSDDPRTVVNTPLAKIKRYKHGSNIESTDRAEIKSHSIQSDYDIVHIIDDGQGRLGGMNGGIFIVRKKGQDHELLVEKRFAEQEIKMGVAKKEIELLRRCRHMALTFYHAAFITNTSPICASVYVEFCDRGSLADLVDVYQKAKISNSSLHVGEGFIWHAIMGLFDALAYLQTGGRYCGSAKKDPDLKWSPILHRDIKPDNIFLRSRTWAYSTKPIYCVLSDFGLACEENNPDVLQRDRHKLGSCSFWAPELLYNPLPAQGHSQHYFPPGFAHSRITDCWALGATIFCLCQANNWPHVYPEIFNIEQSEIPNCLGGTKYRRRELRISTCYTEGLREAILTITAWDHARRPDAETVAKYLYSKWNTDYKDGIGQRLLAGAVLPDWATEKHSYKADTSAVRTGRDYDNS
ncbi:eIF-2-alpha kinase GCN2 [Phlyctema vagabunda]|uniref:non-specific serine/threonine protein kinase n=1 Tax=Phlyctema vagabunda TaxID=108571 RepID=A0ABR4PI48_9HELO